MADKTIRITLDPSGVVKGVKVTEGGLKQIDRSAKQAQSSVDFLKSALVAVGGALAVNKVTNYIDSWIQVQNKIRLVTGETKQLLTIQNKLFQVAQSVRVPLDDIASTYFRIGRNAERLNLNQTELIKLTQSVAKTVGISGAPGQSAALALVQFGQALDSAVLRGDELRSVMEQLPALATAISRGLGVTLGEMRRLGYEGELTSKRVITALQSQEQFINDMFERVGITIGAALQRVENSMIRLFGLTGQLGGASQEIVNTILDISDAIDALADVTSPFTHLLSPVSGVLAEFVKFGIVFGSIAVSVSLLQRGFGLLASAITSVGSGMAAFATGTTFGIISMKNLSEEILRSEKSGLSLSEALESLAYVLRFQLEDTVRGLVDIFGEDIPNTVSVAEIAFDDFKKGAISSIKAVFNALVSFTVTGIKEFDTLSEKVDETVGVIQDLQTGAAGRGGFSRQGIIAATGLALTQAGGSAGGLYNLRIVFESLFESLRDGMRAVALESIKTKSTFDEVFDSNPLNRYVEFLKRVHGYLLLIRGITDEPPGDFFELAGKETDEFQRLLDKIHPVGKATRQYVEAVELLDSALRAAQSGNLQGFSFDVEEHARQMDNLKRSYQDLLDPLGAVRREFKNQFDLFGLLPDEREVQEQVQKLVSDLQKKGAVVTPKDRRDLEDYVQILRDQNRVFNVQKSIYEEIAGSQQDYAISVASLNVWLKKNIIDQEQFNRVVQNIDPIKQRIALTQDEISILQSSSRERERHRALLEVENQARKAGVPETEINAGLNLLDINLRSLDSMKERIRILDEVRQPQEEYNSLVETLNYLLDENLIKQSDANRVLADVSPLEQYKQQLEDENKILDVNRHQREEAIAVMQFEQSVRASGLVFSETELDVLREQIVLLVRRNEEIQREDRLLESIRGPEKEYIANKQTLNRLLDEGRISLEEFNRELTQERLAFLGTRTDLFSGMERALLRIREDATDTATNIERAFINAANAIEDQFVDMFTQLKFDFESLARSIQMDLVRLLVRQQITAPIANSLLGGANAGGALGGFFGRFLGVADTPMVTRGPGFLFQGNIDELHLPLRNVTNNTTSSNQKVEINLTEVFNENGRAKTVRRRSVPENDRQKLGKVVETLQRYAK